MSKLLDMFSQVRRGTGSGGMGFLGKSRHEIKPRAAALVIEFATVDAGRAEAAVKAGADGLLFPWNPQDSAWRETLKNATEAAKASLEAVICGLHITSDWEDLNRESLEQLKELGIHFILLPLQAPARLLAFRIKDVELAVTVPMRSGDLYPIFMRNLTGFDHIAAVHLDFDITAQADDMSIEDMVHYRAVREAVRFPALITVKGDLNEAEVYTLTTLGIQALLLPANDDAQVTQQQIKAIRELLEKAHQEDKDSSPSLKQ